MHQTRIAALSAIVPIWASAGAYAGLSWISVERSASAVISPDLGFDVASSHQLMGWWSESVQQTGPWIPDPTAEVALASATHASNIGFGVVPWAYLAGRVYARHAVPASFGLATATIRLEAEFTITGTETYEIRNMIGSGFLPEAQIQATLMRGSETIFSRLGPVAFTDSGTLTEGSYSLTMIASFSNGDTSSNGISCDMRFTVPSPGVVAMLAGPALLRRRRSAGHQWQACRNPA